MSDKLIKTIDKKMLIGASFICTPKKA